MSTVDFTCWKCDGELVDIPLPVGRGEECPSCLASVRACGGCEFFDPKASKACREPMAEMVADKESANTCDYFRPAIAEEETSEDEAAQARAKLQALFGETGKPTEVKNAREEALSAKNKAAAEAEASRKKLEALFGGEKK